MQRANADCLILTPEEEEVRKKRIDAIKKRKYEMNKIRKEIKENNDEVTAVC